MDGERLCVRCKHHPMAYPNSTNHWCKVCLEEQRKARYNPAKVRDKNLQQNYHGFMVKTTTCGKQQKRHLHVDHDHAKGVVRGLLRNDCNTALGHLHDSPSIIRRLLQYILQHVEEQ